MKTTNGRRERHDGSGGAAAIGAAAKTTGVGRIVLASLIGTAIEFYDFYIYGTAAALVIGQTFFPQSAPQARALNAFLTFGVAFLARPIGAFLRSLLFRDPDGNLVNFFTPVSAEAIRKFDARP